MEGTDKRARALLPAAALAAAGFAGYLLAGLPLGIPGEWVWRRNVVPANLAASLLAAALFVALAWRLARLEWATMTTKEREPWLFLLVALVLVLQVALINSVGEPWISPGSIIISPNATTYFALSMDIKNVHSWVANYHYSMGALPYHARTHPPGITLFFYGVRKAMAWLVPEDTLPFSIWAREYRVFGLGPTSGDAAAAVASALLIALLGALSVVPIYLLCKELVPDRAALLAAALASTLPALLLLSASPDLIVLTLIATTLWLSYVAWKYARPLPAFLAGLIFALSAFLSLGVIAVGLWLLLLAIVGAIRRPDRVAVVGTFLRLALAGLAGFALFYVVLYFTLGYHPIEVARQALFAHHGVTTVDTARTYWKWVLVNPIECTVFAGLPLVIAALWAIPDLRRDPERRCLNTFLIASAIAFGLLDLSGTVRGEVGRIWLFLMWPLAMAAAPALDRPNRNGVFVAIVLLQVLQALLMRAYITPYSVL